MRKLIRHTIGGAGCAVVLAMAACSGDGITPVAPVAPSTPTSHAPEVLVAVSPTFVLADPGADATAPTVVVQDRAGAAVSNVPVRFVLRLGGGFIADTLVKSDNLGRATCGRWTVGAAPGDNIVVAAIDGVAPLLFTAWGYTRPTGQDSYELQSMGGRSLPVSYNAWEFVAGSLVLANDGTFTLTYLIHYPQRRVPSVDVSIMKGSYAGSAPTITFVGFAGEFRATGTIAGDALTLYREDIESDDEVYARRPGARP